MKSRYIKCVQIDEIFRDFERDGLKMSWVYSNIARILTDARIPIFGPYTRIYEIVDIHQFKNELNGLDDHKVGYLAGLLVSSLRKNGLEDAAKIYDFLCGKLPSYHILDHFQVIYDFKELTAYAQTPLVIPKQIAAYIKDTEWKSASLVREFFGQEAAAFSKANDLQPLLNSSVLHVELDPLQIEKNHLASLYALVLNEHNAAFQNQFVRHHAAPIASVDGAPDDDRSRKRVEVLSEGVKHDWIGFHCHLFALERHSLLSGDKKSLIKNPFANGAQKSIMEIMDEWFLERGKVPAKNQKQQYANGILSAIKAIDVEPK